MENTVVPTPNTNNKKKKIIWIILTVIALGLVAYALVQKYGKNKTDENELFMKQIGERMEALSDKDFVLSKEDSEIIGERMEALSDKDFVLSKEDSEIIGERMKSLAE